VTNRAESQPIERRRGPCGKLCFTGTHDARKAHRHASYRIRTYYCAECQAHHVTAADKLDRRSR
jgi:hypothetical protein